jgi:hypothetical protein
MPDPGDAKNVQYIISRNPPSALLHVGTFFPAKWAKMLIFWTLSD